MLPSQGSAFAGDPKTTADGERHPRATSSTFLHGQDSSSSSQSHFIAISNKTNPWFLPATTNTAPPSGSRKPVHPPTSSSAAASSLMIGPTSTFYDPETLAQAQGDNQAQYQQWIDASYGDQHQHQEQLMHPQQSAHHQRMVSYQPSQQQPTYQQDPQRLGRVSDPYSYTQNQYAPTSQHTGSVAGTTIQSNVGGGSAPLTDHPTYHMQPATDPYTGYYSHTNPGTGTNTPDPVASHSVSYTTPPEPLYTQQQQMQHQIPTQSTQLHGLGDHHSRSQPHSRSQSQAQIHQYMAPQGASAYASELLSMTSRPHSNPHSSQSSSLSPASNSWTDEVYSSANSNNNMNPNPNRMDVPSVSHTNTQVPTVPTTSKHVASRTRKQVHPQARTTPPNAATASPPETTPKANAKRKRPNSGAPPPKLYRFQDDESASGSDGDDSLDAFGGGISVGMGGLGVISGGRSGRL
ncbi:hypothetical protein FPV67DRAFT_236263 [Lyophyllum atratum]|nr:hypothetical protein FPV67DRAFT_236263 [Lyophyllum atratum]